MSEEINDAREVSPELVAQQRKDKGFGPGYVNLAVPDRGHIPSCLGAEFDSMGAYNDFCKEHGDWLTVFLGTRGDKVAVVFQILKNDLEVEEMRQVSTYTEEKMAEFRAKRQEMEAEQEKQRQEKEAADDVCRRIGRLCIENHGAFVEALPGLSKIKVTRKSIADDILKMVQGAVESQVDEAEVWKALEKILNKYVKEGAK